VTARAALARAARGAAAGVSVRGGGEFYASADLSDAAALR
jgi:hypothetical protein